MEVTLWYLHHGSYLMELTPRKLPSGTYTMEGPHEVHPTEVTPWNVYHGSYLVEFTP